MCRTGSDFEDGTEPLCRTGIAAEDGRADDDPASSSSSIVPVRRFTFEGDRENKVRTLQGKKTFNHCNM
jgi:hypothetical protein